MFVTLASCMSLLCYANFDPLNILNSIYINDLPKCLKFMALILFADDSTLYLTGNDLTEIQKLVSDELKTLDICFNSNKLAINTDKTKYILFHRKKETPWAWGLKFDEKLLERVKSITFLGVTIDECLNWKLHADLVASKLAKSLLDISGMIFTPSCYKKSLLCTYISPPY